MSFSFVASEMSDDLVALSKAASAFLAPRSVDRLRQLADDLNSAIADAKKRGNDSFYWKGFEPIQVRPSKEYKGGTNNYSPLSADVSVDYKCQFHDGDRILVNGVTVVRIHNEDMSNSKTFHFDAEEGGWEETVDGQLRQRAGHPGLHLQFHGMINDAPRVPTFIVHPVDVMIFAILELHQKKWRDYLLTSNAKSNLRHVPTRQRGRFEAILNGWKSVLNRPNSMPIVNMQSRIHQPFAL